MSAELVIEHPTEDPSLISYVRPELRALKDDLAKARDCFQLMRTPAGSKDRKSIYLPKEDGEPSEAYKARLIRSTYTTFYRDSIRSFAGLLGHGKTHNEPTTFKENRENIDRQGSSIEKLLNDCDQYAMRDGAAVLMVDMPGKPKEEKGEKPVASSREAIEQHLVPYLTLIERANLINWSPRIEHGREVLNWAVIRTAEEVAGEGGKYETKVESVYLLLKPYAWQKVRLVRANGGKWEEKVIDQGETSLDRVPLVWYGATGSRFGCGDLVMAGMADLSIQHMQLRSDLVELIHKLAMPVPVRKGAETDENGDYPPMTLGSNSGIDLPADPGASFAFAEPTGNSLAQHAEEITRVEALMDKAALSFLYGQGVGRTATEAMLQGSHVASQISTMIEGKESAFRQVLELWTAFTNEDLEDDAGLEIDDDLIQRPLEAGEQASLLNLYTEKAISHETLLEEFVRGHALRADLDVKAEIAKVRKEAKEAMAESMAMMEKQAELSGPEGLAPGGGAASPDEEDAPAVPAAKAKPPGRARKAPAARPAVAV